MSANVKKGEVLHMSGARDDAVCEVHSWTQDDFRTKLVPLLRERHGKGGLNVCSDCIRRARKGFQQ